jgi:hypothetical protein
MIAGEIAAESDVDLQGRYDCALERRSSDQLKALVECILVEHRCRRCLGSSASRFWIGD